MHGRHSTLTLSSGNRLRLKRGATPVTRRAHRANKAEERGRGRVSLERRREVKPGAMRRTAEGKNNGLRRDGGQRWSDAT
jgi:hypothetical protein